MGGSPLAEAHEAELRLTAGVGAGHVATASLPLNQQATSRTGSDARAVRSPVDPLSLGSSQDVDSRITPVAIRVPALERRARFSPLSLACPAEVERSRVGAATAGRALESDVATFERSAPRPASGTLLEATPLTDAVVRQVFLDVRSGFVVEASHVPDQEVDPHSTAAAVGARERIVAVPHFTETIFCHRRRT